MAVNRHQACISRTRVVRFRLWLLPAV